MKWEAFECEGCHLRYAIEQAEGDEIEEPNCPACGGMNFETLDLELIEKR